MKTDLMEALSKSYTYKSYRKLVSTLLSDGKSTGNVQSNDLLHYSELNDIRMNRLDKTISLTNETLESLKKNSRKQTWIVISEGWCGDAAQILPIINKMAQANALVALKIVLRDENDSLMNHFLTNGSKAIPVLIILDDATNDVKAHWGPRPDGAKQLIVDYKNKNGVVDETAKIALQKWYLHDKGVSVQNEIRQLI